MNVFNLILFSVTYFLIYHNQKQTNDKTAAQIERIQNKGKQFKKKRQIRKTDLAIDCS